MLTCPVCKAALYRPKQHPDFYINKLQCLNGHILEVSGDELIRHPVFKGEDLGPVKGGGKRARSGRRVKEAEEQYGG